MGERILVVDDEEPFRRFIGQVLTDEGHQVTTATSAEEALETFRHHPCRLVLTDIFMGKMSGLDLLHEITVKPHKEVQFQLSLDVIPA